MVSTETCRIITNQCGRQQQAAWAASTDHVPLGPMVGANTFRNLSLCQADGDPRPHQRRAGDRRHRWTRADASAALGRSQREA